MRRMYEFLCESGELIERLATFEQQVVSCKCGKSARRTISAPHFNLEGWSGHFPTAYHQFGIFQLVFYAFLLQVQQYLQF